MTLQTRLLVRSRGRGAQLITGLLCSVAGTGLRVLLIPYVDGQVPWATSFLAVLLASVLAGSLGALTALIVSAIAGGYIFISPHFDWWPVTLPGSVSLALFVLVGGCIAFVGVHLRRLLRQSDDRAHALEHEARLRVTAEDALRARSEELISENEALSRLHALADHCASPNTSLRECLEEILATALWLTGAEKGNIQLYHKASNSLRLVTHSGFSTRF